MMSVCFVDPSAIKTLIAMYKDFKSRGLIFCLADCSGKVTWFHFLFLGLFNNIFLVDYVMLNVRMVKNDALAEV
jgi:hypothetical protein